MPRFKCVSKCSALLATLPLLMPHGSTLHAGEKIALGSARSVAATPAIRPIDVALSPRNVLSGRVLNADAQPVAAAQVVVMRGSRTLAHGVTNELGEFAIELPHGGVFWLAVETHGRLIRAWTSQAAPPSAVVQVTVSPEQVVVRGQNSPTPWYVGEGPLGLSLAGTLVVAGIVTAIAVPVALHNQNDGGSSGSSGAPDEEEGDPLQSESP